MSKTHWTEAANRDGGPDVLGEDENGRLWVPSRTDVGLWDRPLDLRKPTHWRYYLRSRFRGTLAFVESLPQGAWGGLP